MRRLLLCFVLFGCSITFGQDDSVLTNEKVIEMTSVGLPTSVIITKIKNSPAKFVTDTPALKILTDAKVHETVISAMIERASAPLPEPKAAIPPEPEKPQRGPSPPFTPYSQLTKAEQKERMKNNAQVSIAAPSADVSQLLVRAFQSWNYQLESETSRSLEFTRPVKSSGAEILAGMMGNNNVRHKVQVSMSEVSGITTVIVSIFVAMENQYGKTTNQRLNKKTDRAQLDDLLFAVKQAAERPL